MKVDDYQLSILILSDRSIRKLNKQYFNKDNPTDVISFPMQMGNFSEINPNLLGDIVISAHRALDQAFQLEHSIAKEMDILTIHGILHLLGYNDDSDEKKESMFKKTYELLDKISSS
jgi:probable rRNA maturation factor